MKQKPIKKEEKKEEEKPKIIIWINKGEPIEEPTNNK